MAKPKLFDDGVVSDEVVVRRVGKGKSLTSRRGILTEGEIVTPSDFAGGVPTFDKLIVDGYIE